MKAFNYVPIEQISKNIYDFFIEYKAIILITLCTGIFVNAVDIFTVKFGIDSMHFALSGPKIYFDQQRYGSWILYYLLPFARYHVLSQIIGIFALTLASLLIVSRYNISNNEKLLFMLLFVTYPHFSYLQYFYFQSAYNFIGLLFMVLAYRLIEKNNLFAYILSIILLYIGITSYQANASVFLTVMMMYVILDYINDKNIILALKKIMKCVLFLIFVLLIYYITIKLFSDGLNSYHSKLANYDTGVVEIIRSNLLFMLNSLISNHINAKIHMYYTANVIVTIMLILFILSLLIKHYRTKYYLFLILLIIGFIFSLYSLTFATGGAINKAFSGALAPRSGFSLAFYPAFIFLLIKILYNNKKLKYFIALLTIFIIGYHSTNIIQRQTQYYMEYKQDEIIALSIIDKIYNKYPEVYNSKDRNKYKITFSGKIGNHKHKNHPLFKGYHVTIFNHLYQSINFLKLYGFPLDITYSGAISDKITNEIKYMPSYPDKDCIKLFDNIIVVKLSD